MDDAISKEFLVVYYSHIR